MPSNRTATGRRRFTHQLTTHGQRVVAARSQRPRRPGACKVGCGGEYVLGEAGEHDIEGHRAQAQVVVAGVAAQPVECGVHAQLTTLSQHSLGLLDHDPAVQRGL